MPALCLHDGRQPPSLKQHFNAWQANVEQPASWLLLMLQSTRFFVCLRSVAVCGMLFWLREQRGVCCRNQNVYHVAARQRFKRSWLLAMRPWRLNRVYDTILNLETKRKTANSTRLFMKFCVCTYFCTFEYLFVSRSASLYLFYLTVCRMEWTPANPSPSATCISFDRRRSACPCVC